MRSRGKVGDVEARWVGSKGRACARLTITGERAQPVQHIREGVCGVRGRRRGRRRRGASGAGWCRRHGGTSQEEGEGVSEGVELVEVDVPRGLAVVEGDGLEGDEEEVGCMGACVGPGILGPLAEVVDVGAVEEELATLNGVGL